MIRLKINLGVVIQQKYPATTVDNHSFFQTCLGKIEATLLVGYNGTSVKPRFNEPLYNEVLGIMSDIFQPSNSVMYGKEPRITNPRYNEPISLVPWHFVKNTTNFTKRYLHLWQNCGANIEYRATYLYAFAYH